MANPQDIFGGDFPPVKLSTFELGAMEAWDFGAGDQGVSPLCSGCCLEHAEKKLMD